MEVVAFIVLAILGINLIFGLIHLANWILTQIMLLDYERIIN